MDRRDFLLSSALLTLAVTSAGRAAEVEPPTRYQQARTDFVSVNGVRVAYRTFGQGQPLILLHRFRASMDDWDPGFLNPLGRVHQVFAFDSMGVGESEGSVPGTIEGQADVAVAFMRALQLQRADVLGWSMGGMTAQIAAIKYLEAVRKLVLIGTCPPAGAPEIVPTPAGWRAVAGKPSYTSEDLLFLFFSESAAGRAAGLQSLQRTSFRRPATDIKVVGDATRAQAAGIGGLFKNEGGWYEKLKLIAAPTLIANGDRDGSFPLIDSAVLGREIIPSEVVIYPGSGHGSLFQYPDRVSRDVDDFLQS